MIAANTMSQENGPTNEQSFTKPSPTLIKYVTKGLSHTPPPPQNYQLREL